jgi:putative membrane protein
MRQHKINMSMKINFLWAFAIMTGLMASACNDDNDNSVDPTASDPSFVRTVAGTNLSEVELGRLADSISTTASVKQFGQMMMTDHQQAMNELRALASSKSIQIIEALPESQTTLAQNFRSMQGLAFDTAYLSSQISGHKNTITLFQWEIDNGKDADVKAYATKYLPKIQEHLAKAQEAKAAVAPK